MSPSNPACRLHGPSTQPPDCSFHQPPPPFPTACPAPPSCQDSLPKLPLGSHTESSGSIPHMAASGLFLKCNLTLSLLHFKLSWHPSALGTESRLCSVASKTTSSAPATLHPCLPTPQSVFCFSVYTHALPFECSFQYSLGSSYEFSGKPSWSPGVSSGLPQPPGFPQHCPDIPRGLPPSQPCPSWLSPSENGPVSLYWTKSPMSLGLGLSLPLLCPQHCSP